MILCILILDFNINEIAIITNETTS